jgi:hypothetical protein
MKCLILIFILLTNIIYGRAQNTDSIYAFMNQDLPMQEIGKSTRGIFFLSEPYTIDSNICRKLIESQWTNTSKSIQEEFYKRCAALNPEWQKKFRWEQSKFYNKIIVQNATDKINITNIKRIRLSPEISSHAMYWVRQWNKTKIENRMVDYSSVPLFSSDGNYVLIVRGQDVRSEGGWDTIYIYTRTEEGWKIAERIIISII